MEETTIDQHHGSVNTTKRNAIIIATAIVLSLALSFWIYYMQKQKNQSSQVKKIVQTTTLSSDATLLDTTSWTGFSGTGYVTKYPTTLNTKSNEIKEKVLLDTWNPAEATYSIFVVSNPKTIDPNIKFMTKRDTVKQITVAGQLTNRTMGYSNTGTVIHVGPIIIKDKQYLLIYDSGKHKATPESIQIFDTMVSTFTPGK